MPAYDKPVKWEGLDSEWMNRGACFDIGGDDAPADEHDFLRDLFFSDDERGILGKIRQVEAKRICLVECDLRKTCLEYALVAEIEHGIWGATTGPEREKLIQIRRANQKVA